jgi:protein arginine N-methyltransferase 1
VGHSSKITSTDQIEFIQERSTRVELPERADVIVSDLRGVLPLFEHHLISIADARRRLLVPDGVLIPKCDTLWAAVVEAPEVYGQTVSHCAAHGHDFDMRPTRRYVVNTWCKARIAPERLLVEPRTWATLDYTSLETSDVHGQVRWEVPRDGTAHGLCLWFDTTLIDGIGFSNAPAAPELIYGSAFFPWVEPVFLAAGDFVSVDLRADLIDEGYVWRWDTRVVEQGDPGKTKANFKQSTFYGVPLSPAELRKQASTHVPVLGEDGQIDRQILSLMDGTITLEEIGRRVRELFPACPLSARDILTRVRQLSRKYSR